MIFKERFCQLGSILEKRQRTAALKNAAALVYLILFWRYASWIAAVLCRFQQAGLTFCSQVY